MVAENEPGQDASKLPEDARIDSLEERLRRAQAKEAERTGANRKKPDKNEAAGSRVLSYLLGGLFGGTLVGYAMDRIFDTGGLLLIVGLVLGIVGGFWSIVKFSSGTMSGGSERDES
ncbi:AtpZ/AtpI family protein [Sphingomicrobium sediminis]|uniref:AtpZ/AtpI family protein n=1 Tax=Sphingomicrobium sediminis TaxID=2950949 RepID=A0A9X2EKV0_9SPHN|nr:AtpZ/AtpI family protein [Sphingomicrobium sediminis]MCM8557252.1 AtpZ/AtpI family protein [Sphingomicrobium sediminis]